MPGSEPNQLTHYEHQYRALAAQLTDVGYISAGSLVKRHNRCGKPNCRCYDEPPQMHGPYWQWTAKANGRTVNRRFKTTQAVLYQGWIANSRQLRDLIIQMRHVAAKAAELIIQEANKNAKV